MSAEPRVLLEFEDECPCRLVDVDGERKMQEAARFSGISNRWVGWEDSDPIQSRLAIRVYDAMRAREVRE